MKWEYLDNVGGSGENLCEKFGNFADSQPANYPQVRDRGGGVPDQQLNRIWSYLYTTAPKTQELGDTRDPNLAPLAGFGLGLPLARAHARFCGGKVDLVSLPGHGGDAFVQLNRIGL